MSNATPELTQINKSFIANGAKVIATMDIATRIKDGDAELAARDLVGIYYEGHVAWQNEVQPRFAVDPELPTLVRDEDIKARKVQIVTPVVQQFLKDR